MFDDCNTLDSIRDVIDQSVLEHGKAVEVTDRTRPRLGKRCYEP